MNRLEMTEIFSVMLLAWPNAEMFKGGIEKLAPTIELWTACLSDVDFWTGQQALKKLCRECKFPPTMAEFKERADSTTKEIAELIDMRWRFLRFDADTGKSPAEIFAALEQDDPARLAIIATGGPDAFFRKSDDPVAVWNRYDLFKSAYEQAIRKGAALPASQHKAVPQGNRNRRLLE